MSQRLTVLLPAPPDPRRADIDGLRALAVLAVLMFHAFPRLLPGGFVGVDIFLVISGYLISSLLFGAVERGSFSFAAFYARRARRIFPALGVMLLAVAVAGYFLLYTDEWLELSREILGSCAFLANFLFWHETGYFDHASELKPLLHLWSLAIEEQFYLLWPALIWLTRGRRGWGVLILAASLGTFLAGLYLGATDPTAAFYSPASRSFGLAAGALLAWWELGHPRAAEPAAARRGVRPDVLSSAGLAMLVMALGSISQEQAFPGFVILLPVLGTAALIAAGPETYLNRLLRHPLAVGIGTISYPLYLWHWPLLAFARIYVGAEPTPGLRLTLLGLAGLLAWLTYRLVEYPVRRLPSLAAAARSSTLLLATLALGSWALAQFPAEQPWLIAPHGLLNAADTAENERLLGWFEHDERCIAKLALQAEADVAGEALFCSESDTSGPMSVALIGDSTANALYPGLAKLYAARGLRLLNVGNGTCAPFRGLRGTLPWNRPCEAANRKIYEFLLHTDSVRTVILSLAPWDIMNMQMSGLAPGASADAHFAAIRPLVARDLAALQAAGKHVIVTVDTPHIGMDPRNCLRDERRCFVAAQTVERRLEPYRTSWIQLLRSFDVCLFEQDGLFRDGQAGYRIRSDGRLLFRDDHHLSYFGSDLVAQAMSHAACF